MSGPKDSSVASTSMPPHTATAQDLLQHMLPLVIEAASNAASAASAAVTAITSSECRLDKVETEIFELRGSVDALTTAVIAHTMESKRKRGEEKVKTTQWHNTLRATVTSPVLIQIVVTIGAVLTLYFGLKTDEVDKYPPPADVHYESGTDASGTSPSVKGQRGP